MIGKVAKRYRFVKLRSQQFILPERGRRAGGLKERLAPCSGPKGETTASLAAETTALQNQMELDIFLSERGCVR
jgi:hypothetical protein